MSPTFNANASFEASASASISIGASKQQKTQKRESLNQNLIQPFRYRVDFFKTTLDDPTNGGAEKICGGAFSEVSGFEATMEPHTISEGGRNWGQIQRAGKTTFATLILKRGMTADRGLWTWFQGVAGGAYAYRLNAVVTVLSPDQPSDAAKGVIGWEFANCLPVMLKAGDLNATTSDIAIEELHLNHEGMALAGGS